MAGTRFPNTYVNAQTTDDKGSYLTLGSRDDDPKEVYLALEDDHGLYTEANDAPTTTTQRSPTRSNPLLGPGATPSREQRPDPVVKSGAPGNTRSRDIHFAVLVVLAVVVILLCGGILAGLKFLAGRVGQQQRAVTDVTVEVQELANKTQQSTAHVPGATLCTMSVGAPGGDPFSDLSQYIRNGSIRALDIRIDSSDDLYMVGFRARYGSQKTVWRGRHAGQRETFALRDSEVITGMTVYVGKHSDGYGGLVGLSVLTNLHRQSAVYGDVYMLPGRTSAGEVQGRVEMSWDELLYFSGSAGHIVDKLDVHAIGCRISQYIANE